MVAPPRDAKSPDSSRRRPGFIHTFINRPAQSYWSHLTDGNESGTESETEFIPKEPDTLVVKSVPARAKSVPPPPRSSRLNDVEAQSPTASKKILHPTAGAEYNVETSTKLWYLTVWFTLNLSLTIYNKALLKGFAFPWLLTALHTSFVSVGCYCLLLRGRFKLTTLPMSQSWILVAFSLLFTFNIAMSNVSLAAVSVPFHQIMRSTIPAFIILIYRVVYSRTYSWATYLTLIPIIFGVGLATYGDVYFTIAGFILTLFGVILAAIKTVVTNRLMTGALALPALEILLRMSPLATLQSLAFAYLTGEFDDFLRYVGEGGLPLPMYLALAGNGAIAFWLNISSFQTNKIAGALTMTVAGNLKQCLTILLGILLFNVQVNLINGSGMAITILGAAWYSKVELDTKGKS